MKLARISLAPLALLIACSSSATTEQDPGLAGEGDTAAASAPDTNPDGVAYPTDNIGTNARSGNRAGNRIANYKFVGYPDGDPSKGLQPISLANYFDPTGTKVKLIHIQASGSWCPHCVKELEAVSPIKDKLDERKVVWIVSLAEGPTPGTPSKVSDLDKWLDSYKPPFTHVLDSGNKNLGPFYDAAALPWNASISAKTMEILSSGTGAIETSSGILADIDEKLEMLDSSVGLK
jgi:thiol-disulfide isomerase/thioredoxin